MKAIVLGDRQTGAQHAPHLPALTSEPSGKSTLIRRLCGAEATATECGARAVLRSLVCDRLDTVSRLV